MNHVQDSHILPSVLWIGLLDSCCALARELLHMSSAFCRLAFEKTDCWKFWISHLYRLYSTQLDPLHGSFFSCN